MEQCVTRKKMYASLEVAEDVLVEAWTRYDYAPGTGPVAVYQCIDCGRFHLTSKGEMNPKLAQYLREGRIARQKEADKWLDKLKKR